MGNHFPVKLLLTLMLQAANDRLAAEKESFNRQASMYTNARTFVPSARPATKVIIKSQDGREVTLDALKKHSPQPPTVPIPLASPILTNRRTTSIRMETEEAKRLREDALRVRFDLSSSEFLS